MFRFRHNALQPVFSGYGLSSPKKQRLRDVRSIRSILIVLAAIGSFSCPVVFCSVASAQDDDSYQDEYGDDY